MKIKALLFDLDGTLLNTLTSINYYLNKTLREYKIGEIDIEKTRYFVGDGAALLVCRSLEYLKSDVCNSEEKKKEVIARYVSDYDSNPYYLTAPYDGILELIEYLKENGYKLGVVSNKPHTTVAPLVEKFFSGSFDAVLGGKDGTPLKPKADMPLAVCRALGVAPGEVMYLGDTSTDMITGKAFSAGISVGVSWGFRDREELLENGADRIVDTPFEVRAILDGLKA